MIIITNKGLIDPLAFELIGASTKRNDNNTIGFFGSGIKYAIAGLLQREIPFQIWRGKDPIDIQVQPVKMRDTEFNRIIINGNPTSLTTAMGPKWETWMLIRELYANAIDEGGEMAITNDYHEFIKEEYTTIILPDLEKLEKIIDQQDFLFTRGRDIIYENNKIKIYEDIGDGGFYVKGIYVGGRNSGHGFELKIPYNINEERTISDTYTAMALTFEALMSIDDKKIIKKIVSKARTPNTLENSIFMNMFFYSINNVTSSSAWHDIIFFPADSANYATERNHVVVSDALYKKLNHPNKWTKRKWEPSGTKEQNEKLSQAISLIKRYGSISGEFVFGRSESKTLGMGEDEGVIYVSDNIADESIDIIASHLVLMMSNSNPSLGLKCLSSLFRK